jgi:hypothetical protein
VAIDHFKGDPYYEEMGLAVAEKIRRLLLDSAGGRTKP